ncbi:unnamed protein product, partial [Prorocentrum cordatum]
VDEEIGSGPEARPPAGQQGSSLGAAAAAAALGGAAVALGGFGLAGSSGGPDLDEAAREAAESEGFAFRALGDGPAEERPCKVCRCALPLRAKHCFECGRCVRTHDHHCPWIANCVGERNRALFFWFVALQGAEAWWLLSQQGRCLGSEAARSGLFVVALVLVALFAFCLGSPAAARSGAHGRGGEGAGRATASGPLPRQRRTQPRIWPSEAQESLAARESDPSPE